MKNTWGLLRRISHSGPLEKIPELDSHPATLDMGPVATSCSVGIPPASQLDFGSPHVQPLFAVRVRR